MQLMVIQDSDNLKIGNLEAKVGMELANGYTVIKVNEKSVIAEHDGHTEKFFHPTSIFYTEAVAWEFSETKVAVDGRLERLAAKERKFQRGEIAYQKFHEYGSAVPLKDRIEQAGYNFAEQVEAQRHLAISDSLVAEVEEGEEDKIKFLLTFDVSTPTSEYEMFRIFKTESENLARDEAIEMEWQLSNVATKVLFAKLEACE